MAFFFFSQIKNFLLLSETIQLCPTAPDDCILSCLGSPQLVQIQTPLDTRSESLLDYVPSYSQEVQVESVVITQYDENELKMSVSEKNDVGIQSDAQDTSKCDPDDTKHPGEVTCEIESLDLHVKDTGLDERSKKQDPVEVSVVAMEAADGGEESQTHGEESRMVRNQKETDLVSVCTIKQSYVKLDRLDLSDRHVSKAFTPGPQKRGRGQPKKSPQKKTVCRKKQEEKKVPCASINKYVAIIIIIILHQCRKKKTF